MNSKDINIQLLNEMITSRLFKLGFKSIIPCEITDNGKLIKIKYKENMEDVFNLLLYRINDYDGNFAFKFQYYMDYLIETQTVRQSFNDYPISDWNKFADDVILYFKNTKYYEKHLNN